MERIARLEEALRGINYLLNFLTRNFLRQEGLTLPRFWALLYLARRERTTMGELQERLLISPGSVTALVDGLVGDGLVERCRSEEDRRLVVLSLSPAGKEVLARAMSFRHALLREVFGAGAVTETTVEVLEKAQRRLEELGHRREEWRP
jgi:DNA-binding MarR family transcriptional regulator